MEGGPWFDGDREPFFFLGGGLGCVRDAVFFFSIFFCFVDLPGSKNNTFSSTKNVFSGFSVFFCPGGSGLGGVRGAFFFKFFPGEKIKDKFSNGNFLFFMFLSFFSIRGIWFGGVRGAGFFFAPGRKKKKNIF